MHNSFGLDFVLNGIRSVQQKKNIADQIAALEAHGEMVQVGQVQAESSESKQTTVDHVLYKVAFSSIVLLDTDNDVFFLQHRSGQWTPPGGQIESNESSWTAAKREFQEETGKSFENLIASDVLTSVGIFVYFHPESAHMSRPKLNKQEDNASSNHTITINYVFRTMSPHNYTQKISIDAYLFSKGDVTSGETRACFYPLKEITTHRHDTKDTYETGGISIRACPMASLLESFPEHFSALKLEQGRAILDEWHQARNSHFVGNVLEEARKHGRWIWRK